MSPIGDKKGGRSLLSSPPPITKTLKQTWSRGSMASEGHVVKRSLRRPMRLVQLPHPLSHVDWTVGGGGCRWRLINLNWIGKSSNAVRWRKGHAIFRVPRPFPYRTRLVLHNRPDWISHNSPHRASGGGIEVCFSFDCLHGILKRVCHRCVGLWPDLGRLGAGE